MDAVVDERGPATGSWTSTQVYVMAVVCLLIGIAVGYLVRGSAGSTSATNHSVPAPAPASASVSVPAPNVGKPMPEQLKQMAEQKAAPLLAQLKASPNDANLLANIGNIYSDAQQYKAAAEYYRRSLEANPGDPNVRTDMGTAYFYLGDVDGAIREFTTALRYDPKHAQTLFNLGMVKWQAKGDAKGAVESWERLLRVVPNYPERAKVQELISRAKQHGKG